jgi:ribosomal protein L40E
MATTQKWNNLATLIIAKEEHKRKFGKGRLHTINYNINLIGVHKELFINCLGSIMEQKYLKYINERKITIPKLDGITEYNCETDCPICFETFGIDDDDDATIAEGDNCEHQICQECYIKIIDDTNRCPICRVVLDNDKENETETDLQNREKLRKQK